MVHARLGIGADNSGKLVTKVKTEARRVAEELGRDLVLVDGPPGMGCPVMASLVGASLVVLVTEPTVSARHDLTRVHALVSRQRIPCACIINKADLNPAIRDEMRAFLSAQQVERIAEFPYDEAFSAAITAGRTIVEWSDAHRERVAEAWSRIIDLLSYEETSS
jgi:MinD superfamily P-loop ATPase